MRTTYAKTLLMARNNFQVDLCKARSYFLGVLVCQMSFIQGGCFPYSIIASVKDCLLCFVRCNKIYLTGS